MTPPASLLRHVSFLASLTDEQLDEVARRFRERRFGRGSAATSPRSTGVGFFVIAEGHATVRVHGQTVRQLGPGDHFGELAIIDRNGRSAEVLPTTNILAYGLSATEFRALVDQHPDVAWALLQTVVAKLRETEDRAARSATATRAEPGAT
jgi:CRP-like cAMP-binding protein